MDKSKGTVRSNKLLKLAVLGSLIGIVALWVYSRL